jgi:hypothetical protein
MIDVPVTLATGRPDLALDPPTFTDLDFTIYIFQNYAGATPYIYTLYMVNDPTTIDFISGANSPTGLVNAGNVVLMDTQNIVGPLTAGQAITSSLPLDLVFPIYRQASWVGRLAMVFRFEQDGAPAAARNICSSLHPTTPEVMATEELPFIGGRSGNVKARSRYDRCPVCGFYDVREKFVPDGYRQGVLVCKNCWDPYDPPDTPIPPDAPPIND